MTSEQSHTRLRVDMCIDVHINMCVDTSYTDCGDTGLWACIGHCKVLGHVRRHVYRHAYRHVYRHVCRHVYRHAHRHVCRHVLTHVHRHVCRHVCRTGRIDPTGRPYSQIYRANAHPSYGVHSHGLCSYGQRSSERSRTHLRMARCVDM